MGKIGKDELGETRQTTKRNKKMSNNTREKIDRARMQIRMADNPLFCFDSILNILEEVASEVDDLRSDLNEKVNCSYDDYGNRVER